MILPSRLDTEVMAVVFFRYSNYYGYDDYARAASLTTCVYMYVYAYMRVCVYIYIYTYAHVHLSLSIYIYIYICMYLYVYVYMRVCVYIYIYNQFLADGLGGTRKLHRRRATICWKCEQLFYSMNKHAQNHSPGKPINNCPSILFSHLAHIDTGVCETKHTHTPLMQRSTLFFARSLGSESTMCQPSLFLVPLVNPTITAGEPQ